MKRIVYSILLMLLISYCPGDGNANAQKTDTFDHTYLNDLTISYSNVLYYPRFLDLKSRAGYFGTINLSYNRIVLKHLSVNATVAYARYGGKGWRPLDGDCHDNDYYYSDYSNADHSYNTNSIYAMAGIRVYYLVRPKAKLYGRLESGVAIHLNNDRYKDINDRSTTTRTAINFVPIGVQLGHRTAFTMEYGFGSTICLITIGITHRF